MASLTISAPTKLRINDITVEQQSLLQMQLTYEDEKARYEYTKFKHATWYANKFGQEAYYEELAKKKAAIKQCLLFEDDDGFWTYSGLAQKVARILDCSITNNVSYPSYGTLGWNQKREYPPYPYQETASENLLEWKHAAVSIGTGLGKSFIIELMTKEIGLRTVVMAPSESIARQLFKDAVKAFGPKYVGFYGAGTKKIKTVTIAIAASLTKVKEDSADWATLSKTQVFMADESHQCPAKTLQKVCFGVMANAPYRFFFSATQMRNDGLDMLLEGIIGPIVYSKTVKEGISEGYLAALDFAMLKVDSYSNFESGDPNEMTRVHMFYNDDLNRRLAGVINGFIQYQGKRVLVLIDEFEQFSKLYPFLKHTVKFAHGGVTAENKDKIPQPFHDSDPTKFVEEFNDEKYPILIGTSCIATGTDVKANEVTVYLRGGKSEIEVMQGASGRSTRLFTFKDGRKKTNCLVLDVDVQNVKTLHRHARARAAIYSRISDPVREIPLAA